MRIHPEVAKILGGGNVSRGEEIASYEMFGNVGILVLSKLNKPRKIDFLQSVYYSGFLSFF